MNQHPQPIPRLAVIDQFRGLAILLMALTHLLSRVIWVPTWLKNSYTLGFSVVDLIAPMFIFAMGLTYRRSFEHRCGQDGVRVTYLHFLRRALALIGVGALITPKGLTWGLFQTLGVAVFLTLLVIRLPRMYRLVVGVALLCGYQILLEPYWLEQVLACVWGGLPAALSWTAMLILVTVMVEGSCKSRVANYKSRLVRTTLFSLAVGLILSIWIPISMHRASISYILIGLGTSGFLFVVLMRLSSYFNRIMPYVMASLANWGKNPLLLYVLHYYLWVYVFLFPKATWWHREAVGWLLGVQAVLFIVVLNAVAGFLARRRWFITL